MLYTLQLISSLLKVAYRVVIFISLYCRESAESSEIEQVITAARMKTTAFWDLAPCSPDEVDRRFRGAYCLHHQDDDG
jgi:hypothetical protein